MGGVDLADECGGIMKPKVLDYQAQAVQCLEAAQSALTPEVRQAYLDLMKQLIELAEETARLDEESSLPLVF
jgi:hypothetical protein